MKLIVEGFWTQRAAEQASWVVTQMTPQKAEDLFGRVGNMEPSKSSLDRLPKAIGERWEAGREAYEQVLREAIVVPDEAYSIAVSLDGVLALTGYAQPNDVAQVKAAGFDVHLVKPPDMRTLEGVLAGAKSLR